MNIPSIINKIDWIEKQYSLRCPALPVFTDAQNKKIKLTYYAALTSLSFAVFGTGLILSQGSRNHFMERINIIEFGVIGAIWGSRAVRAYWPEVDYQKPEVANQIRVALKSNTFSKLSKLYNFSELAKYGYISNENAEKMQLMDDRIPLKSTPGITKDKYREAKQQSETEFSEMRKQPGFQL